MEVIVKVEDACNLKIVGTNAVFRGKQLQYGALCRMHQIRQPGAMHRDDVGRVMEQINLLGKTQLFELDGAEAMTFQIGGDF